MGPTVVITGGNRGIGLATAEEFARRDHRVVIVARNPAAAGEAARLGADLVAGDLSTLKGVRAVAEALAGTCPRLDVLVHNAGVWPSARRLTEDGFEESFAVNHLAPFLLNHLLEDRLARVVQVTAGLYVKGRADLVRTPAGTDFSPLRTYADTKLCNLALMPLWAERWKPRGITIDAVHPGVIRTGLGDRGGPVGVLLKTAKLLWKAPADGAAPVVRLALDQAGTGRYFDVDRELPLASVAADLAWAGKLWTQAAELTGVA
ncbi:SDR family NAD(P)-dependent oxidoreductase [Streptosporangium sp. NPDC006013]|uniref:SDR family NAD(P)-dependent oxidoreductase n=1 Tax=Streptosporangium sp. NPDC006013 TaxID=3155596 RepID=UPI0033BEAB57